MISKVKEYRMDSGIRLGDYLENKNKIFSFEWNQTDNIVTFSVNIPQLRSPNIYKWEVKNNEIFALNGSAISVTPELNKRIQELEKKKESVPLEQMRIYNFVKQYHLEEDQPIETVLEKANVEFGLSKEEIDSIYLKVDRILYGK